MTFESRAQREKQAFEVDAFIKTHSLDIRYVLDFKSIDEWLIAVIKDSGLSLNKTVPPAISSKES